MPREKEGFRDVLSLLIEKNYPAMLTKTQAGEILGVSQPHLRKMIQRNHIVVVDGKIPIGSVASYICG